MCLGTCQFTRSSFSCKAQLQCNCHVLPVGGCGKEADCRRCRARHAYLHTQAFNLTALLRAQSCRPCGPLLPTTTCRRPQRLGLGAAPAPEQQQKKYIKPGGQGRRESRLDQ